MITFTAILSDLQAAIAVVAARERTLTVLLVAVWGRIARMRTRLERLIARWRAGIVQAPRKSRADEARASVRARAAFPTAPAWLLVQVQAAASYRAQLEHLLSQAECAEFLAAVPQAGRILRPLCRMLGIGVAAAAPRKPPPVWAPPVAQPPAAPPPGDAPPAETRVMLRAGLALGPAGRFFYV